jgi:dTDP-4-dehydrorhamnose 3,5-epimerase
VTKRFLVDGAIKSPQSVSAKWLPTSMRVIDGVEIREVLHVPRDRGYLTEVARTTWLGENNHIDQVFQVVLPAGAVSAWHAHAVTTDRIFVTSGLVRIVLYDRREDSPTEGLLNEFRFGTVRPALVTIPPRIWHGVQNLGGSEASILNLVDRAYTYEDPDSWRVPPDSPEIPFSFPPLTKSP